MAKEHLRDAYFGHHPKRKKKATMARKKLRTIGHRVVRELERKLPEHLQKRYESEFSNYKKVLTQERNSKEKIYSLHEPQTGVITAIKRFSGNPHDSKKLEESLNQTE